MFELQRNLGFIESLKESSYRLGMFDLATSIVERLDEIYTECYRLGMFELQLSPLPFRRCEN